MDKKQTMMVFWVLEVRVLKARALDSLEVWALYSQAPIPEGKEALNQQGDSGGGDDVQRHGLKYCQSERFGGYALQGYMPNQILFSQIDKIAFWTSQLR